MYRLFIIFVGLVGCFGPVASIANEPQTIDGFPCAEVAAFPSDPAELTDKQLFYAAHAYDSGDCGWEDDARARRYYQESADRGDQFAMIRLGYFYLNGDGTEKNIEKARYWFRSYALAYPYENAENWKSFVETFFYGEPLPELFLEEMTKSAREYKGGPEILMRNYRHLSSGNGARANPKRAEIWLFQAVEFNDPLAHYEYAQIQREKQNPSGYFIHLKFAAELNYPTAQKELGEHYLANGTEMFEKHFALVWLLRAQRNGLDVTQQIKAAEQQLDNDQVYLARKAAVNFDFDAGR